MKKSYILLIALVHLEVLGSYSQNLITNIQDLGEFNQENIIHNVLPNQFTSVIPCNPNTFWVNTGYGTIDEFSISGSQVASTGISYVIPTQYKAAIYANNASVGPTFYSVSAFDSIRYFDGTSWPGILSIQNLNASNGGGNGDHIYFGNLSRIYHYSALTGIDTVYTTPPNKSISAADYAVDATGNCYFLTKSTTSSVTDTLVVINAAGSVLYQFPVSINTYQAYGAFMIGNIFYLGLGPNALNPLTLIPITITPLSATVGAPISFALATGYADLESCNQGLPLGLWEIGNGYSNLKIYPNPASQYIQIGVPPELINKRCELKIATPACQLTRQFSFTPQQNSVRLELEKLHSGMYFILLNSSSHAFTAKFLVH